jgi:hypothetical protein
MGTHTGSDGNTNMAVTDTTRVSHECPGHRCQEGGSVRAHEIEEDFGEGAVSGRGLVDVSQRLDKKVKEEARIPEKENSESGETPASSTSLTKQRQLKDSNTCGTGLGLSGRRSPQPCLQGEGGSQPPL